MSSIIQYLQPSLAFYELVNDAVLITDLEGNIIYGNTSSMVLLAVEKKKILNKKCIRFFLEPNVFSDLVLELGIKKEF